MRKTIAAVLALLLVMLTALAGAEEEIVENVVLDAQTPASVTAEEVFTPSYGSEYGPEYGENPSTYWTTPMDITDEAAVWEMLMQPITVVDIGKKSSAKVQTFLYREPDKNSTKVGVVTCESQGVRVLETLENGWSRVECYSSSFHGTEVPAWNILVNGYLPTEYLKQVEPDQDMGIVIDKLTQRLYLFAEGKLLSTLLCSTGLAQWNGSKYQPYNETRSGEFLTMGKLDNIDSDNLKCPYAVRFNSGDMMHEVPHTLNADESWNYKYNEPKLGTKCSHGCIRVQYKRTPEGINMKWIFSHLTQKSRVKLIIWEDWQGRQIPVPSEDTVLYYNPNGGSSYHRSETCYGYKGNEKTMVPFLYSELDEGDFAKLKRCTYCCPVMRKADIEEINARYAPGGDHDELLTKLRQDYYDMMAQAE